MTEDDGVLRTLPDTFAEHARRFYTERPEPVQPRRAATVMILRDLPHSAFTPGGIQVYMLRRMRSMAFAGGLYAFPGGRMDPSDIDVLSAAVREVQEETGLRLSELHAWSRWVTPEFEPRRYDTWFYVARAPEDADPRDISGEADWAGWMSPAEALEEHGRRMLPPTAVTLGELSQHLTVDSVLSIAEDRDLAPIVPRAVVDGPSVHLALPWDPDY
ncbi:MAG TPA: NUDIX hydrolase [Stackebrandtia sp.]|uniref:NUDIX hydrolase n=1 Tax=Stackebrandtia sp. TaxID=2023065 RepID=UPI002D6AE5CE|nr:NUDIX hydrolase [Stackebrandtia sp.]HZE41593.1 NUDIX hydrolase [Stackebrandtia sp.]